MTAAAALGRFELQRCLNCGAIQYPPREACHRCLSDRLEWTLQDGAGELLSETLVHHSHEPYFRELGPWRIGMIRLDAGVTLIAFLHAACPAPPGRVRVQAHLDRNGQAALVAFPAGGAAALSDDPQLAQIISK